VIQKKDSKYYNKQYTIKQYSNALEIEVELDITDENLIENADCIDYESIEHSCSEYIRDKYAVDQDNPQYSEIIQREFEKCVEEAVESARENAGSVIVYYAKTDSVEVESDVYVKDSVYYECYIQYLKFKFKHTVFFDTLDDLDNVLNKLENEIVKNV